MTLDMIRREERQEGYEEGHKELLKVLYSLVSDGVITIEEAASRSGIDADVLEESMKDFESE